MYIHISKSKFGCIHCIKKRGKLYDGAIDRQMDDLRDITTGLNGLIDSKHDLPEEVSVHILDALDKLDNVRLNTLKAIGKDVVREQTELWVNGK